MPWANIMATGSVEPTEENLKAWFEAGAFCVGMGSKLFPKEAIAEGRWDVVTELCHSTLEIIAKYKK
jgi:2-dehydro-3-deoxyphosphogluconate aldolase/(4S)-4-hydroxy-2-oxoglutarate aldolase